MGNGRPHGAIDLDLEMVARACRAGLTNQQLADIIGVDRTTIHNWLNPNHASFDSHFFDAVKNNRPISDDRVERSLYERACGYEHVEDKVFMHNGQTITEQTVKHYPPDTAAAFIWLKNRRPKKWRDKIDTEISGTIKIEYDDNDSPLRMDQSGNRLAIPISSLREEAENT